MRVRVRVLYVCAACRGQLGEGDISAYNAGLPFVTANIDALARAGVRFTESRGEGRSDRAFDEESSR